MSVIQEKQTEEFGELLRTPTDEDGKLSFWLIEMGYILQGAMAFLQFAMHQDDEKISETTHSMLETVAKIGQELANVGEETPWIKFERSSIDRLTVRMNEENAKEMKRLAAILNSAFSIPDDSRFS